MALRVYASAVLTAVAALWSMSGVQRERPVLGGVVPRSLRALEAGAAARPDDTAATRALAQAYVDVGQPGLAIAVVQAAPARVRAESSVMHVYARALFDEGESDRALAVEREVVAACRPLTEGGAAAAGCDPVLLASALRRVDIFRELVVLGVRDAQSHPEAALVAYQNATREARVVFE